MGNKYYTNVNSTASNLYGFDSATTGTYSWENTTITYPQKPSIIYQNDDSESKALKEKVNQLEALFFRKVVSKCPACGQWGAALCECKHCGHPIDMGEAPKGVEAPPARQDIAGRTFVANPITGVKYG
jgi:hypothetical protein